MDGKVFLFLMIVVGMAWRTHPLLLLLSGYREREPGAFWHGHGGRAHSAHGGLAKGRNQGARGHSPAVRTSFTSPLPPPLLSPISPTQPTHPPKQHDRMVDGGRIPRPPGRGLRPHWRQRLPLLQHRRVRPFFHPPTHPPTHLSTHPLTHSPTYLQGGPGDSMGEDAGPLPHPHPQDPHDRDRLA